MADVNSAEHNLAIPIVNQTSDFGFDRLRCPTLQARTHLRDDAVGTAKNAAVLDFHERSPATVEMADAIRNVDNAEPVKYVWKLSLVADDFKHAGQVTQHFGITGCVTSHDNCAGSGIFSRQLPNQLPAFRIGLASHRTGVDDAKIRRLIFRRLAEPIAEQRFFDELRFVLVNLASKGHKSARAFGHGHFETEISGIRVEPRTTFSVTARLRSVAIVDSAEYTREQSVRRATRFTHRRSGRSAKISRY